MSQQGGEPCDEQKFILPNWLEKYPGRHKPQTQWVIEQLRSCVCLALAVRNKGEILINDQSFTLHKCGDYTTIKIMVKQRKSLSKIQLLALQELCSVARKFQETQFGSYAVALESTIADLLDLH